MSRTMTLAAGTKLGPYEIVAPLGAGGMGEVYRARDPQLGRNVAIKILPSFLSRDADRLRRFEHEARAAAALNHPNILAVYQLGSHDGIPYLVSELLEGNTLRESLLRGPVPVRKAVDYAIQTAHGLAAAHEKGIVHRDLKPENLFLTKDGRIKILDFGLAKIVQPRPAEPTTPTLSEGTEPGVVLGTVGYMSPEQVRGEVADGRADLFALGAILHEMLTGKRAFHKPTSAETMTAILNEEPPPVSQLVPAIPPALQKVVHRSLEKSPQQRFHSASDLAFALEALSDSGSSPGAAGPTSANFPWQSIAIGSFVVVILLAGIAWWGFQEHVAIVDSVTQLTDDAEPKFGSLASDGTRIYFSEGVRGSLRLMQVSVAGGSTATLPVALNSPRVSGISPDGSMLIVLEGNRRFDWLRSVPLPAGEPRKLGALEASNADVLPDGKIIFSKGTGLYLADPTGMSAHQILTQPREILSLAVSPSGNRIVFDTWNANPQSPSALFVARPDGKGLREILHWPNPRMCCARWSADGNFLVFRAWRDDYLISDLWAVGASEGWFHRRPAPFQLTNGPLSYSAPLPGRDRNQIFAIGTKRRGELMRYDQKARQFVPLLGGISAIDPTFSQDGKWVAYLSYPDHLLWRSRTDGSERKQLTYPPMVAAYANISPDGEQVAFHTPQREIYVVHASSDELRKVGEHSMYPDWSPDGKSLAMSRIGTLESDVQVFTFTTHALDLRTGNDAMIPESEDKVGAFWLSPTRIVTGSLDNDNTIFSVFDFLTGKWTEFASGSYSTWFLSSDRGYLYCTTGGANAPEIVRIRISDGRVEPVAGLEGIRRASDPLEEADIRLMPDGSPIITRDIGSQEIYALRVKWP